MVGAPVEADHDLGSVRDRYTCDGAVDTIAIPDYKVVELSKRFRAKAFPYPTA